MASGKCVIACSIIALLGVSGGVAMAEMESQAQPCQPQNTDTVVSVCGLPAPEDIAPHPEGGTLFVSLAKGLVKSESGIALYEPARHKARRLEIRVEPAGWGEDSCTAPDQSDFEFHGIDVHRLTDGTLRLLAVNHLGGESIDMFEVVENVGETHLLWRGCVATTPEYLLNDVAGFADGGFVTTQMVLLDRMFDKTLMDGRDTGFVTRWTPGQGLSRLPDSEGAFSNGIVVDRSDEKTLFFAEWTGFKITRYDLESEKVTGSAEVGVMPDNLTQDRHGDIVSVGFETIEAMHACMENGLKNCSDQWHPVKVNHKTMAANPVLLADGAKASEPVMFPTVAVPVADWLYVGSLGDERVTGFRMGE